MTTESPRNVKVILLVRRNPAMTEDEFHEHWRTKHPAIVNDWLKKHGITRYIQYHTPSSERTKAQRELQSFGSFVTDKMLDYDGIVELQMPSAKCWDDARNDPYYKEHVQPDEEKFADFTRSTILAGYEEQQF